MQKLTYSEGKVQTSAAGAAENEAPDAAPLRPKARSSMGIGINAQSPDEGRLKGKQAPAACGVWFTSSGRILPKMLKFQETDGQIVTLTHIRVLTEEEKHYCGIPTLRYKCTGETSTEDTGKILEFTLLYYIERQEWKLLM